MICSDHYRKWDACLANQPRLKSRPEVRATVTSLKTKAQPGTTVPHISARALRLCRTAGILELGACNLELFLAQLFHHFLQRFLRRTQLLHPESRQRILRQVQQVNEAGFFGVEIKDAGQNLTLGMRLHESMHRPDPV